MTKEKTPGKFKVQVQKSTNVWGDSGYVGRVAYLSKAAVDTAINGDQLGEYQHNALENLDNLMAAAIKGDASALQSLGVAIEANSIEEQIKEITQQRETLLSIAFRGSLDEGQQSHFQTFLDRLEDHHTGNVAADISGFRR